MKKKIRTGPVVIRPGRPDDGPALKKLIRLGRTVFGRPRDDVRALAEEGTCWFVVGASGDDTVGYMSYELTGSIIPILRLRAAVVDAEAPAGVDGAFVTAATEIHRTTSFPSAGR